MKHTEKWYQQRLTEYFEDYYDNYRDDAEYYADPDINQWSFEIVENGKKVHIILTCNDDGSINEERLYKINLRD